MFSLLCMASAAAYWFYKRRGFNYNINIGFNKNRSSVHEFANAMQQVPCTSSKDDHLLLMSKEKVPLSSSENPNYIEVMNKSYSVYPVEEELQDLMKICDTDSYGKGGDVNSDDDDNDQQRLIR